MESGYVLDFTNRSFEDFFRTLNIDIYSEKYAINGDSKAKRLRSFWDQEDEKTTGKVLEKLLEVWVHENPNPNDKQKISYQQALKITRKLQNKTMDTNDSLSEGDFLNQKFDNLNIKNIGLDDQFLSIIQNRLDEAKRCLKSKASLSVIFLSGSILEGVLLFTASKHPKIFNIASSAPKDKSEKVKQFQEWTLSELINVAHETNFLSLDVKKFSHELRGFRNYIHPFEQACSSFFPDQHTAEICLQVLKAAIADLSGDRK